ncbi:MAG: hypothetical protein ACRDH9_07010 [Actinomycetota bacterium]
MTTSRRLGDQRGVVGISLVRWGIVLVLLGLVLIEGGSIIFTTIGLQNAADVAGIDAADTWAKTGNLDASRQAALLALRSRDQDAARIPRNSFEADGAPTFEVRFEVVKQARTLVVQHIGFLEDLAEVSIDVEARPIETDV